MITTMFSLNAPSVLALVAAPFSLSRNLQAYSIYRISSVAVDRENYSAENTWIRSWSRRSNERD
jgi:hypothetical protein